MSTITTKQGDQGKTSLIGASKVSKSYYLIEIIGQIDRLQAVIGLLKVKLKSRVLLAELTTLQENLSLIMAYLANPKASSFTKHRAILKTIEHNQSYWQKQIVVKNKFSLPGQNEKEALANLARVTTRDVERQICKHLQNSKKLKKLIPIFNRLSDYFFVVGQYLLKLGQ